MLTDSHCHLHFKNFEQPAKEIIEQSQRNDVTQFLTVAVSLEDHINALNIAEKHKNVYCSVGIHPLYVEEYGGKDLGQLQQQIIDACQNTKVVAIGECGLDYYKGAEYKKLQQEFFKMQIECSQETGKTLIIHSRDAEEDSYKILQERLAHKPFNAVMHCFTGSAKFAQQCLDLGFYISASGVVTYPKATDVANVFKDVVPIEKMLIETDCPYLAPQGYRGKTNSPAYLKVTAEHIAQMKNISYEELGKITTQNFNTLFKI